jgi:hypothetical protein
MLTDAPRSIVPSAVLEVVQVHQVVGQLETLCDSVLVLANMQILDLVVPRQGHLLVLGPKDLQGEQKHSRPLKEHTWFVQRVSGILVSGRV